MVLPSARRGGGDGNHGYRSSSKAVEPRKACRPEGTLEGQGHLGHSRPAPDSGAHPGSALFDLGIDSKLRGCDLVKLRVRDVCHGDRVAPRAIVLQQKTHRPVQFEITPST